MGYFLAYLFSPLISHVQERWHVPRVLSITLLLVGLAGAGVGFIIWMGPIVEEQVRTLTQKAPAYLENIAQRYGVDVEHPKTYLQDVAHVAKRNLMTLVKAAVAGTNQAFGIVGSILSSTTYFLISTALIPVYFFFFAWHFPSTLQRIKVYLPASQRPRLLDIFRRMDRAVGSFFRGRLVIALLMGILLSIGWFIVDVPYWFLLGLSTGLLSIIPYGATLGWPLAIVLKYLDTTTGSQSAHLDWAAIVLWPSVVYGVVQLLEGWVLTPWIQSQSTELSAVTILIVVFIGGAVGGVWGLILAVPVTACLKIFFQEVLLSHLKLWAETN